MLLHRPGPPRADQSGQPVTCPGRRSRGWADPPHRGGRPHPSGRLRGQLQHRLRGAELHRGHGLPAPGAQLPRLLLPARPQRSRAAELRLHLWPARALRLHPAHQERADDTTPEQPGGPGWLLTEFGATTDTADLARITADANANLLGWIYWQWINYDDPTGSHSFGAVAAARAHRMLDVLSRTYAVGGGRDPHVMSFDPARVASRCATSPTPHPAPR